MKRLLLTMSLIISSFFFISLNPVKAVTQTFKVYESSLNNYITRFIDNNYLNFFNDYAKSVCSSNYFVYSDSLFCFDKATISRNKYSSMFQLVISGNILRYDYSSSEFIFNSSNAQSNFEYFNSFSSFNYISISPDNLINELSDNSINFIFNEKNYIVDLSSTKLYSMYDFYLETISPEEPLDPYEEEKEKLSSFYSLIIEKIVLLVNIFSQNYIFLFILGITIFISLFYLILRRRL